MINATVLNAILLIIPNGVKVCIKMFRWMNI
jgi:hypothetical protein